MAYEMLLREGRINSMVVRNRMITGPMERAMANRDGTVNQAYIDYVTERARGGAGLIIVESTYVDTRGMGRLHQLGCHDDRVIPGLKRLADAVHAEGAKVSLELYMGGRETPSYTSQRQPIAPSPVRAEMLNPVPTPREMTVADIEDVIGKFADAARRVVESGLDMVLLHGAHGYLLCSFLSPFTNKRLDRYGGSLEGRARFGLELLAAVREAVGPGFPIGYRISAEEYLEEGLTIDEGARFCAMLADAGIDLIDVSGGIYDSSPMIIQGPEAPRGGFIGNAREIKKAVGDRVSVSVTQRLNDPDLAEGVLRREGLDFISMTRAFHADPHFVNKVAEDRVDEIVPCIACHDCTNMLEVDQPVRCAVNPSSGLERERRIRPVTRPRNVMVIGGGPAGLQASRILAEQGNKVSLFEQSDELGGQVRYSSRIAPDYADLITYLTAQMKKLKVDVHLNTRAGLNTVSDVAPEAIIVATGAGPGLRFCPFKGSPTTFDLFSAMDRPDEDWEERAVVIGGDSKSCAAALYIAGRGAEVHVVEPRAEFAYDKLSPGKDRLIGTLVDLPTVHLRAESTVEEVGEGYVVIQSHGRSERLSGIGSVVVGGRTPNNGLYEEILQHGPEMEVYNIGDSVRPRDVYHATHEAADVAETIRLRAAAGT